MFYNVKKKKENTQKKELYRARDKLIMVDNSQSFWKKIRKNASFSWEKDTHKNPTRYGKYKRRLQQLLICSV